jgi:hypothetical protein
MPRTIVNEEVRRTTVFTNPRARFSSCAAKWKSPE